jgi:hypothetical protein
MCSRSELAYLQQKDVRAYCRRRLSIDISQRCNSWPIPDPEQVRIYNVGQPAKVYPNNQELRLDWFCLGTTTWTKDCATIFANEFCAQHRKGAFPLVSKQISVADIEKMFVVYVIYLKRRYARELHDVEAASRLKAAAGKRSRSTGRREQVSKLQ